MGIPLLSLLWLALLLCLALFDAVRQQGIGVNALEDGGVEDGRWLQELYVSTNGVEWQTSSTRSCNSGWNTTAGANPCATSTPWTGVFCNAQQRVFRLMFIECNLRGSLPELTSPAGSTNGPMSQLQFLHLIDNQLNGTIPGSWGSRLVSLQYLDLSTNNLTGSLPSSQWWGSLTSLQHVDLGSNQLRGTVPESIGYLSQLQFLSLFGNRLSGTIPTSWGSLGSLQYLNLGSNHFTGTIPSTFGSLNRLQNLQLRGNQFNGTVPMVLGSLTELQQLNLAGNQLSGSLPSSWSNLHALQNLSLSTNDISGSLPPSWYHGMQHNLSSIDLYGNCMNISSADMDATQWLWWMSKSYFGLKITTAQRTDCNCAVGQLRTMFLSCTACPAGFYCPNTSTSIPCPVGTYNPTTGQSNATAACVACPTGTTTNTSGQNSSRSCTVRVDTATTSTGGVSAATTEMSTVAVAAGLPLAMLSMTVSASSILQRSVLQLRLGNGGASSCSMQLDDVLDPASSPTQLAVGSQEGGGYIRGAVVGNVLLMAGCGAVALITMVLRAILSSEDGCSVRSVRVSRKDAAALHLPGQLATPGMFLLQPTLSNSITCFVALSGGAADVVIGLTGCGVTAACVWWSTVVVMRVNRVCEARRRRQSQGLIEVVHWMFTPLFEWQLRRSSARRNHSERYFVQQHRPLFDGYRSQREWFLCVEMATAAVSGVVGGLQPSLGTTAYGCRWLIGSLTAVNGASLAAGVALRPYQRGWELLLFSVTNALGVAWGVASLVDDTSTDIPTQLAAAQVWLVLVQIAEIVVEMLLLWTIRRISSLAWLVAPVRFSDSTASSLCIAPSPGDGRRRRHRPSEPTVLVQPASREVNDIGNDTRLGSRHQVLQRLIRSICNLKATESMES